MAGKPVAASFRCGYWWAGLLDAPVGGTWLLLSRSSLSNFARNSAPTGSNIELASLELQRFWGISKNDHDKLRAKFGWRWCRRCPRVSRLGAADEMARWYETAIAFAGEKWAFLVQLSGAEVMPVSEFPCWGRAVVLVVSTSPCCCALCAKKFALRGLMCA